MIKVIHVKDPTPPGYMRVTVDRTTSLGNPFRIIQSRKRHEAIEQYATWLPDALSRQARVRKMYLDILKLLRGGNNVALVCHCAPRACHADVLKKKLEEDLES